MFHTGGFLGSLAGQVGCLKIGRDWHPLDASPEAVRIRNFMGGLCLDFNISLDPGEPITVESLTKVLRPARKEDRISRFCPTTWREYPSQRKLELFHLLQKVENHLHVDDLLNDELRDALTAEAAHHPCLRHFFYEAHNDWNEAIFTLKIMCNNVTGKSAGNVEHYTMMDEGSGSTAKGTLRELFEAQLGVFTGGEHRGYTAVITKACLQENRGERGKMTPNEELSNMKGSVLSFCDDFDAKDNPLSSEKLKQISGGNSLTAARKNKGNEVFKFNGMLVMMTNGAWKIEGMMDGADLRRFARQWFLVKFKANPKGPMERLKDRSFKNDIGRFLPELWWLCICYHHIRCAHSTQDRTLPLPPTVLAALSELEENVQEDKYTDAVKLFVETHIKDYVSQLALPKSAAELEKDLEYFLAGQKLPRPTDQELRDFLRRHFVYKPSKTINKFETRKKVGVNVYTRETGEVVTFKP